MSVLDEQKLTAARAYVDALVSHDPTGVPLAADCRRIELGVLTGRNGGHITRGLSGAPQFKIIHGISHYTATIDAEIVYTSYRVLVYPKALRLYAEVRESFEFNSDGQISRIVAKFGIPRRG